MDDATKRPRPWPAWPVAVLWCMVMLPLVHWGLPTDAHDGLLFGGDEPWAAERFDPNALGAAFQSSASGADTDLDAPQAFTAPIDITADEEARAAILLRYRLYSHQPDEMIVLRSLAKMRPQELQLDPQLYQYGGAYVYGVGAALGVAGLVGYIPLTSDLGHFLEDPDAFGRFYVVGRVVTLAFGAVLLLGVFHLARQWGGRLAGWVALLLTAAAPVVIADAVELKPHLPSAALLVWATWFAARYLAHRRRRDALALGLCSGAAVGLILTGAVAVLLWPALLVSVWWPPRGRAPQRRLLADLGLAALAAAIVYALTNPFVLVNALGGGGGEATLDSNLGNSLAMYRIDLSLMGVWNIITLLAEATGGGTVIVGLIAVVLASCWQWRVAKVGGAAAAGMLLICILLGGEKPVEFGRFLVLPAAMFAVAAALVIAAIARHSRATAFVLLVLVLASSRTPAYVMALWTDTQPRGCSRHVAAETIAATIPNDEAIAVVQMPAPYSVPPLDFTRRTIVALPPEVPAELDAAALPRWLVCTPESPELQVLGGWGEFYEPARTFTVAGTDASLITWANKPVQLYQRRLRP